MTLGTIYRDIKKSLDSAGIASPDLDARLLMSYALGVAPDDMRLKPETPAQMNKALEDAVKRRLAHEPVSKITGTRGFYGLEFEVTKDVLDPRADTETLVDAARRYLDLSFRRKPESMAKNDRHEGCSTMDPCLRRDDIRILDICTGTGCIPLALLGLSSNVTALAVDISDAALDVAKRNARKCGLENRIEFRKSDWLESVDGIFDIITCNPPYIPTDDIKSLDADVRLYDPRIALDGGKDGLAPYRILFPQIRKFLREGGKAFFEIGIGQASDVVKIVADCGLSVDAVLRDLGGIERVVCVENTSPSEK